MRMRTKPAAAASNAWLLDLQKQNEELVGWIRIPGTVIDYPVMQTGSDNDYYLTHDFNREENAHGAPFLDVNCKIGVSDNLIIYGHHMKDGTMFQNLMKYKDAAFCESNGTVEWDTPEETCEYQIIYVMLISAEEAERFPYYKCIDLSYEEIYEGFLKQCSRYAIWPEWRTPESGYRAADTLDLRIFTDRRQTGHCGSSEENAIDNNTDSKEKHGECRVSHEKCQ